MRKTGVWLGLGLTSSIKYQEILLRGVTVQVYIFTMTACFYFSPDQFKLLKQGRSGFGCCTRSSWGWGFVPKIKFLGKIFSEHSIYMASQEIIAESMQCYDYLTNY